MKPDVKILLIGLLTLLILAAYYFANFNIGAGDVQLRKADFADLYILPDSGSMNNLHQAFIDSAGITTLQRDTLNGDGKSRSRSAAITANRYDYYGDETVFYADSAQNILFFGDSMLEGLSKRFIDYTEQNHHQLHSVIWYSSSSDTWANTDTLQFFLKKFNPSYVVICLGSNELFVKDIDKRKENIKKIVGKLGKLPFVWVSPPNWKDDTGINDAIISIVGEGRYFDSRNLTLARKSDHAHPTDAAAVIWMDTIARWIKSPACAYPLVMDWPEKDVKSKNVTLLKPYHR